jgi:hypothetical protein
MKHIDGPSLPDRVPPHPTADVSYAAAALGTPAPPARSIDLLIDEMVLHGFSPAERQPIADAVAHELSALMERGGLPWDQSAELDFLSGAFRATAAGRPESIGAGIARAIYGGLRP